MGHKIRPDSFRLGIIAPWKSRWFSKKNLKSWLEEDHVIREVINDKIADAGIVKIVIERNAGDIKINIKAARPGLIIGRGGKGIEDLILLIKKALKRRGLSTTSSISLNVEELRRTEVAAQVVGHNVAADLEKRLPFRRVLKKYIDQTMQNRDIQGIKIYVSGRLGGAEIARSEWLAKGKLPLHTLRANIDYAQATAFTTYGTIGVKVWIYKGDVFSEE